MSKTPEQNSRALKRMFTDSYNNLCALENLSVNPHSYYSVNVGPIQNRIYTSRSNRNGRLVNLPSVLNSTDYLRFSLAINIFGKEDKADKRAKRLNMTCLSLAQRSALNRLSVEVYADNVKVPDDQAFITVMDGTTDLYVPKKYFEVNGSQLDIIVRKYNKKEPYINQILNKFSGNTYSFILYEIDPNTGQPDHNKYIADNINLNIKDYRIYKNGLLLQEKQGVYKGDFFIEFDDETCTSGTINFTIPLLPIDTLEICIEPETNYREEVQSKQDQLVLFPKNISNLGQLMPISPGICDIYMEGRRMFARDLEVLSPRIFKIKNTAYRENGHLSVFINYNGKNVPNIDYKEDTTRYLHTVNDTEVIQSIYLKEKYPDDGLTWLNNQEFPPKRIYDTMNKYCCSTTYNNYVDESIKKYIDENAHNIIQLLSEYSVDQTENIHCNADYNDEHTRLNTANEIGKVVYHNTDNMTSEFVTFKGQSFITEKVSFTTRAFFNDIDEDVFVFVNNLKLRKEYVTIINYRGTLYIYIEKSILPQNEEYDITFVHIPIYNDNRKYVLFDIDTADEITNNSLFFDKSLFGSIQDINDLFLYKEESDDWRLFKYNYTIRYADEVGNDGMIEVIIPGKKLYDKYLIMNSSFYQYKSIDVNQNLESIDLDMYDDTAKMYLPSASNYSYILFKDGVLQIEGIDYFVTSQLTHNTLNQAKMIFNNRPEIGSKLELYFYEQPRISYDECKVLNLPYDVIYIKNCEVGFSHEYMDLYINDKIIPSEYITEIALNLLLLKDLPEGYLQRPYNEVYIKTRFTRPLTSANAYIDYYNEHQSDWKLYIDRLISSGKLNIILDIVKAYLDGQTPHDLSENPDDIDILISPIIDLIARHIKIGKLPKRIDANTDLLWLKKPEYLQMMSRNDLNSPTIEINANNTNITESVDINPTNTLRSLKDITEIVSRFIRERNFPFLNENNLDANLEVTEQEYYDFDEYGLPDYSSNPISSLLYLEELHLGQPDYDQLVPDLRNIDANINIENTDDDDYEIVEKTVTIPFSQVRKQPKLVKNSDGKLVLPTKDMTDYLGNIVYDEDGNPKQVPDIQFIYTIDLKKYSIDEFKELKINNITQTLSSMYQYSNQQLAINREIDYSSNIEITYTTKIYMK